MKVQYFKSSYTYPQFDSSPYRYSYLTSFHPHIEIEVSDECEGGGDLNVHIKKDSDYDFTPPESNHRYKVKKIIKSDFEKLYNTVWKYIHSNNFQDSECYLLNSYKGCYDFYAFTNEKVSERRCCHIHVYISDDWFDCRMSVNRCFRDRPRARKKGEAIEYETFHKVRILTLDYLRDPDSLKVLMDQFSKMTLRLIDKEDAPLEPLRNVIDYSDITKQIMRRKESLTTQLIEEDGTREERLQLRAEIKGLEYALKVIEMKGQMG